MNHQIKTAEKKDLERIFPVIKELRPHLDFHTYLSIYEQSHLADQYEMAYIEMGQEIIAVMGYRVLTDFVRGQHLYIDDLVTKAEHRSKGLGAVLLNYAQDLAAKKNCSSLRLSTGLENSSGIRFYERENWTKRAYIFVKKV